MKHISIVTACYNEQGNITELHERITQIMSTLPQYSYEIICIDNCSVDGTRDEIRKICAKDHRFKAIFNVRNFGHIRSPWYAFLQAQGDAVIALCSDLEDPPELIPAMLEKWEQGYKLAFPVRTGSEEKGIIPCLRSIYYWGIKKLSDVEQINGFTGFGLYDKKAMDVFRSLDDPYPYTRGLVAELGWKWAEIPFLKPQRTRGFSKRSLMVYFDLALQGMVNHTKIPLRFMTIIGMFVSFLSFIGALFFLLQKLFYWDTFQAGIAPVTISQFFLMGVLFFFMGILGEYIGFIVTHVVKRPLVIEEERINFDTNEHSNEGHTKDNNEQ